MAYLSSTVGSSANPPVLMVQGIASTGLNSTAPSTGSRGIVPKQWMYNSTHTSAEVAATGFITDGKILGMTIGDLVLVVGSTTFALNSHAVIAVSSTGVNLSTGVSLSS